MCDVVGVRAKECLILWVYITALFIEILEFQFDLLRHFVYLWYICFLC